MAAFSLHNLGMDRGDMNTDPDPDRRKDRSYRLTPLDRLRQCLYHDATDFDEHDLPILYVDDEMEEGLKRFEKEVGVCIPDELYEIFASVGIRARVRERLRYHLTIPKPSSCDEDQELEVLSYQWVPLPQPPEDMDFAFMIAHDERKHRCAIIGWKSGWSKTGMMYGCKYADYQKYMTKVLLSDGEPVAQPSKTPVEDEDGFLPASSFNKRRRGNKKVPPATLTTKRLLGPDGRKLTFTNFLLSAIPKEKHSNTS